MHLHRVYIVPRCGAAFQAVVVRCRQRDERFVCRLHSAEILAFSLGEQRFLRFFFGFRQERDMGAGTSRGRRAVTFTLDDDVVQILRLLSPSGKGYGETGPTPYLHQWGI
jgi:hypothetical protein